MNTNFELIISLDIAVSTYTLYTSCVILTYIKSKSNLWFLGRSSHVYLCIFSCKNVVMVVKSKIYSSLMDYITIYYNNYSYQSRCWKCSPIKNTFRNINKEKMVSVHIKTVSKNRFFYGNPLWKNMFWKWFKSWITN